MIVRSLEALSLAERGGVPGLVRPVGIIHRRQQRLSPTVASFIDSLRNAERTVGE